VEGSRVEENFSNLLLYAVLTAKLLPKTSYPYHPILPNYRNDDQLLE
jgi:hypothetical protein